MRNFHRIALIIFCLGIFVPAALAVNPPELDDIISPIDASKAVISGTTEPGYKIITTGGSYDISPIYADDDGRFEVTVALIQESTNTFTLKAEDEDGNASDSVQATIIEGVEAAAAAEAAGGGDHTAPGAPDVDDTPESIDASTYTFTGYGEANTTLIETNSNENVTVDSDGYFEITLDLAQNTTNTFKFILKDAAGNISATTKVEIDEEGEDETTVIVLSDIAGHWAEDYIIELVADGVVEGYSDETFRPDSPINRAEFTKIVLGALGYTIPDSISESSFSDAPIDTWYAPYTQTAYDEEIVEGYSDGTFGAANYINRAEAVKILLNAAGVDATESLVEFPDVDQNAWYAPYVATAYSMGIISGYENGNFGPADNMTRAQVCKVIVELLAQI